MWFYMSEDNMINVKSLSLIQWSSFIKTKSSICDDVISIVDNSWWYER